MLLFRLGKLDEHENHIIKKSKLTNERLDEKRGKTMLRDIVNQGQ